MADGCETGDVRHIQKNEDLETNPANQFGYDSALNASKPIDFPVICTCKTRVSPCHCSKKKQGGLLTQRVVNTTQMGLDAVKISMKMSNIVQT